MKVNIGVELGAKLIQAAIVNNDGRLLSRDKTPANIETGMETMVSDAVKLIKNLIKNEGRNIRSIKSIGIAIPGIIDDEGSMVLKAHVTNLWNAPIKEEFQKYFNVQVNVENDAHCAAIAESTCGAAENLGTSMTINVGTGISGGIIVDNRLQNSGFIGHMVINPHGKECYCGQHGCFEALCSAKALTDTTREIASKNPKSKIHQVCNNDLTQININTLWEAMNIGDEEAKEAYQEYVENFAIALSNYANIFLPEAIVVCGGIMTLGEDLLRPIRERVFNAIYSKDIATLPMIKQSEMGSASILIGAGMLRNYKKGFI